MSVFLFFFFGGGGGGGGFGFFLGGGGRGGQQTTKKHAKLPSIINAYTIHCKYHYYIYRLA